MDFGGRLEESGEIAILGISDIVPAGPNRQAMEMGLTQCTLMLKRHLGPTWRPLTTCMVYGPPKSLDTHHRILGRSLEFNADFNGVVFDRADLDRPNAAADPETKLYNAGLARKLRTIAARLRQAPDADMV